MAPWGQICHTVSGLYKFPQSWPRCVWPRHSAACILVKPAPQKKYPWVSPLEVWPGSLSVTAVVAFLCLCGWILVNTYVGNCFGTRNTSGTFSAHSLSFQEATSFQVGALRECGLATVSTQSLRFTFERLASLMLQLSLHLPHLQV